MALNLATVDGYVKGIRTLLQDKVRPYRYSDIQVLVGLNVAFNEGFRVRPDIFIFKNGFRVPQFETVNGDDIPIEAQFRLAFQYGAAAHVLLRDEEDVQDSRANSFDEAFHSLLLGARPSPIHGGTPTPGKASGNKDGGQPPQA